MKNKKNMQRKAARGAACACDAAACGAKPRYGGYRRGSFCLHAARANARSGGDAYRFKSGKFMQIYVAVQFRQYRKKAYA